MTTATTYVRRATAQGALVAAPNSAFIGAALDAMTRNQLGGTQACPHVADRQDLHDQVALWPTFGEQAGALWCLDCWVDPGRTAGCQACDRQPVPGLRRILSPPTWSTRQIVVVGQLCTLDRRRLA